MSACWRVKQTSVRDHSNVGDSPGMLINTQFRAPDVCIRRTARGPRRVEQQVKMIDEIERFRCERDTWCVAHALVEASSTV